MTPAERETLVALRREIVKLLAKHEGPSVAFDRAAEFFERDTGMLPPGKDDALGHHPYEQRGAAWLKWREEHGV